MPTPTPADFSAYLKRRRRQTGWSQLDLALRAEISQKHLSFLETGRARPSRIMVMQLTQALELPLRERNEWLRMAGFAPVFHERGLDDAEMAMVDAALTMTLQHHQPFPAIVVDRHWNLQRANASAEAWLGMLGTGDALWQRVDPSGGRNVYRLTFSEHGLRPYICNWAELAHHLLARLQGELAAAPDDTVLRQLYDELILNCPDMLASPQSASRLPVLPTKLDFGGHTLNLFSMISGFGTPQDITAAELRVETFFPADEKTRLFFESL